MIYLLLEQKTDTLKMLFSGDFQHPKIDYLFDNTEISNLKEHSPLLIQDTTVSDATVHDFLKKQSGLLITSKVAKDQLLFHLRYIMLVYFSPEQFGLLRYYDPFIASYFFKSLNEMDTAFWLGPIDKLEWYNATWRERVNNQDDWKSHINTPSINWQQQQIDTNSKPVLQIQQKKALEDMQKEKFAYEWQQDPQLNRHNIAIDKAITWVKQGILEGFTKKKNLNQYLSIRANYPEASSPTEWPSELLEERTIYLERYLKQLTIG